MNINTPAYFTADLGTARRARLMAEHEDLVANGREVDVAGSVITLTDASLEILSGLPEDSDGHYDGTHLWVGGSEYEVRSA